MNKDYGKITDGEIEYADDTAAVYDNVLYRPVPGNILELMGFKRIVRSVPQYPAREGYKWVKTPDQDDTTIFYRWTEEKLTDAEYVMECHTKLNDSDWATTAYVEGALSEDDWNEWKSKRKVWRDFIREHEQ